MTEHHNIGDKHKKEYCHSHSIVEIDDSVFKDSHGSEDRRTANIVIQYRES